MARWSVFLLFAGLCLPAGPAHPAWPPYRGGRAVDARVVKQAYQEIEAIQKRAYQGHHPDEFTRGAKDSLAPMLGTRNLELANPRLPTAFETKPSYDLLTRCIDELFPLAERLRDPPTIPLVWGTIPRDDPNAVITLFADGRACGLLTPATLYDFIYQTTKMLVSTLPFRQEGGAAMLSVRPALSDSAMVHIPQLADTLAELVAYFLGEREGFRSLSIPAGWRYATPLVESMELWTVGHELGHYFLLSSEAGDTLGVRPAWMRELAADVFSTRLLLEATALREARTPTTYERILVLARIQSPRLLLQYFDVLLEARSMLQTGDSVAWRTKADEDLRTIGDDLRRMQIADSTPNRGGSHLTHPPIRLRRENFEHALAELANVDPVSEDSPARGGEVLLATLERNLALIWAQARPVFYRRYVTRG